MRALLPATTAPLPSSIAHVTSRADADLRPILSFHNTHSLKQVCIPDAAETCSQTNARPGAQGCRLVVFGVQAISSPSAISAKPPDCEDLRTPQHLPCARTHLPFFALCASKLTASFPSQPVRPSATLLTKGDLQTLFQLHVVSVLPRFIENRSVPGSNQLL
jgi:hypothetical protein